ncbi:hypothetical protein LshimejAT787_0201150 [Lyophyllum shimeji]|uniref:Uncharacterized protein n=1 Tax=Lyophyllum shimeji TaxID=47721 RepID=A0A9P3PEK4_LYOSH|nr:hypothetical protein LshimejAT787_0201150 [Lyophyllum shimeji]
MDLMDLPLSEPLSSTTRSSNIPYPYSTEDAPLSSLPQLSDVSDLAFPVTDATVEDALGPLPKPASRPPRGPAPLSPHAHAYDIERAPSARPPSALPPRTHAHTYHTPPAPSHLPPKPPPQTHARTHARTHVHTHDTPPAPAPAPAPARRPPKPPPRRSPQPVPPAKPRTVSRPRGEWAIWSRHPRDPAHAPSIIISPDAKPPREIVQQALDLPTPQPTPPHLHLTEPVAPAPPFLHRHRAHI